MAPDRNRLLPWLCLSLLAVLLYPAPAAAFWLLGFSTADVLPYGSLGAIAGTGGQFAQVGNPSRSSFTPFLPHAGLRVGLGDGWDIGYRLTQVPLPFSSAGPSLGGEIDLKRRLTPTTSPWQAAVVVGFGYSYLMLNNQSKSAYSPGVDLILSRVLTPRYALITELRDVYTAIPTATGGSAQNNVNAAGADVGLRIGITPTLSVVPEVGLFDFTGRLLGRAANGFAAQYGAVLAFKF